MQVVSGRVFNLAINAGAAQSPVVVAWPGGTGLFTVEATFGGGNVNLQVKSQNGTLLDVSAATKMTASGVASFTLPAGSLIQATITTSSAVYAYAIAM